MKIGVLTALWRRPGLSAIVLDQWREIAAALRPRLALEVVAVGSEGAASARLAEARGFRYVEHPNAPLGAKWNAGLAAFREVEVEGVLVVGSDDLVNAALFEVAAAALAEGVLFFGLRDLSILDLEPRRLYRWQGYAGPERATEPIGVGRTVHRTLLEAARWRLWPTALDRGLDRAMVERLEAIRPGSCAPSAPGSSRPRRRASSRST